MDFVKDQNSKSVIEFKIIFHFKSIQSCRCFFLFIFPQYFPNFTMQIVDNILTTLGKGQFLKFQHCLNAKPKSHIINGQYILGFPLSRDFSNFQVPGLLDLLSPGTTGPSRSLGPVLSSPGTQDLLSRDFPGLPGTSQDQFGRLFLLILQVFLAKFSF